MCAHRSLVGVRVHQRPFPSPLQVPGAGLAQGRPTAHGPRETVLGPGDMRLCFYVIRTVTRIFARNQITAPGVDVR